MALNSPEIWSLYNSSANLQQAGISHQWNQRPGKCLAICLDSKSPSYDLGEKKKSSHCLEYRQFRDLLIFKGQMVCWDVPLPDYLLRHFTWLLSKNTNYYQKPCTLPVDNNATSSINIPANTKIFHLFFVIIIYVFYCILWQTVKQEIIFYENHRISLLFLCW